MHFVINCPRSGQPLGLARQRGADVASVAMATAYGTLLLSGTTAVCLPVYLLEAVRLIKNDAEFVLFGLLFNLFT